MKVKMLVGMAGVNWSCSPGDEIEVTDAEAVRFFEVGYAEPIRAATVEKATAGKREKAVSVQKDAE